MRAFQHDTRSRSHLHVCPSFIAGGIERVRDITFHFHAGNPLLWNLGYLPYINTVQTRDEAVTRTGFPREVEGRG